jgi:hypothetical protein
MKDIPWIPILLIGGMLGLELIFNNLIVKNEKYRRIKAIVFISIASIILIFSLIGGDMQQIQFAVFFVIISLVMLFYKKKGSLGN